jgi:peptidoglycan hydrolase-like protein with peptidoglycan-binding domain
MSGAPAGAQLSEDGAYWWDGANWQVVTADLPPLGHGEQLVKGDSNDHVGELQQRLAHLGYYHGQVDSYYGDSTESAVRQFQQDNGQTEDGIAGTETWQKVEETATSQGYGAAAAPAYTEPAAAEPGYAEHEQAHAEQQQAAEYYEVGQLSPDGAWRWNGTDWEAAQPEAAAAPETAAAPAEENAAQPAARPPEQEAGQPQKTEPIINEEIDDPESEQAVAPGSDEA